MSSSSTPSRTARCGSSFVVALSLLSLSASGCGAGTNSSPPASEDREGTAEGAAASDETTGRGEDDPGAETVPRDDTTAQGEEGPGAQEDAAERDGLASNTDGARPIVSCASPRAGSDPYQIRSRSVEGDVLTIVLTHGGGCGQHDFHLCYDPQLLETDPVQANLRLEHDAHGDVCRRIDRKVLRFDLSPLRDHYRAAHPSGNTLVLNLDQPITYEL